MWVVLKNVLSMFKMSLIQRNAQCVLFHSVWILNRYGGRDHKQPQTRAHKLRVILMEDVQYILSRCKCCRCNVSQA